MAPMDTVPSHPKPRLRGRFHQVAFFISIPAGLVLISLGRTGWTRLALGVYAVSLVAVYGASASYHRMNWKPRAADWMRRLDHAAIYLLIAGTATAFSVLALDGTYLAIMLTLIWTGTAVGIGLKLAGAERFPVMGSILYIGLGWIALVGAPEFVPRLGFGPVALMLSGGLFFTVGAILLGLRRPDPRPEVFGYHEVWHSMVIAGTSCHYALLLVLVR
jgi:hemolysin III